MSLLDMDELRYIGMVFNLLQGPFIFAVAMCRTRVAFLFKKYFCHDSCCFGFCKSEEFINEECEELATIGKKYALKRYDQFSLCLSNNKYSVKSEYKNCYFVLYQDIKLFSLGGECCEPVLDRVRWKEFKTFMVSKE